MRKVGVFTRIPADPFSLQKALRLVGKGGDHHFILERFMPVTKDCIQSHLGWVSYRERVGLPEAKKNDPYTAHW
jgi:hypothetical protein